LKHTSFHQGLSTDW